MKKAGYVSRTIDDKIVRDGLSALSTLDSFADKRDLYAVVGGIATQSFLPSSCRRDTADIDVLVGNSLDRGGFLSYTSSVKEYLQDKGFSVEVARKSRSWNLTVNSPNDETILLEFSRFSPDAFEKKKNMIERELENARQKIVETREDRYRVVSPEDIAVPKFTRSVIILQRQPEYESLITPYTGPMSDELIRDTLNRNRDMKSQLLNDPENLLLYSKCRFLSDIYDIRILNELTGFNENALGEVARDWPAMNYYPEIRDKLVPLLPLLKEVL